MPCVPTTYCTLLHMADSYPVRGYMPAAHVGKNFCIFNLAPKKLLHSREAEAGGSQICAQPGKVSETLSHTKT